MLPIDRMPRRKLSTHRPRTVWRSHNQGMNAGAGADGLGRFLTIADTAELLNISAKQAYALVHSGELPAIRLGAGGQWRVERSVLEAYIDAMYEATRRMSLWNQSDYSGLSELNVGVYSAPTT